MTLAAGAEPATATRTGAEALCHALLAEGVDVIFGHPGGAIMPFYDALYRIAAPRHVLMRHEQGAAHAADGYARATGRPGVCVATSGPGATNLVTGLAAAIMDSVPLVAITGQVPLPVVGTDAFQETDILGVTMPVTKHGFLVTNAGDIPAIVAQAFRMAREGRPGPVLIDVPKDVQNAAAGPPGPAASAGRRYGAPEQRGSGSGPEAVQLDRAAELVNNARRPVVLIGRGAVLAGVGAELVDLVERADLPVSPTLLGLDGFPATHPLCLGLPGMHGTERANQAIQAADVILGLGLRFDDRVTGPPARFAPGAAIIHLDIDPRCFGRTVQPAVRLIGDLRETLPALSARITPARHPDWWAVVSGWRRQAEGPVATAGALTGRVASRALAQHIARTGATVATDVGQHQMWLAQELLDAAPGTHLTSGGLGAMGYALPAGLGAAVGRPDRPAWVVTGDGGLQMTLQELATVVQESLPLKVAVYNNGFLGMVRQWQELFFGRRYSATALSGPDYVRLAEAFGMPGRAVDRIEDLDAALAWAEAKPGPALLELRVAREENVYPMVPPGATLDQLVLAPAV